MYVQDYDEHFPNWNWTFFCNGGNNGQARDSAAFWTMAIQPYIKNDGVYKCPDDVLEWNDLWANCSDDGGKHDQFSNVVNNAANYVSYGLSEDLTGGWPQNKLAAVSTPSNWMLFCDNAGQLADLWVWGSVSTGAGGNANIIANRAAFSNDVSGNNLMWQGSNTAAWFQNHYSASVLENATRHHGGNNVSFVDGHSKYYRWTSLTYQNLTQGQ